MRTQHNSNDEQLTNLTRRQALKAAAGATGAVTVGYGADRAGLSPVGGSDALTIGIARTAADAGESVADWLFGDSSATTAEEASSETETSVAEARFYEVTEKRKLFNERLLESGGLIRKDGPTGMGGLKRIAIEEAQIAAVNAIQNGSTESETLSAGKQKVDDIFHAPMEFLCKQWNESVGELMSFKSAHSGNWWSWLDPPNPIEQYTSNALVWVDITTTTTTVTLPNGDQSVIRIQNKLSLNDSDTTRWDSHDLTSASTDDGSPAHVPTNNHTYLKHSLWKETWDELQTGHQEARNSIDTWVLDVYGAVQAGDLDVNELLSGAAIATKAAEASGLSRAQADLISLGADVALERAVTITTAQDGIDWTMTGMLAATESPSGGFAVGNTYTPNSADNGGSTGTVWMVAESDDMVGSWSNYNAPVDGGLVSFTQKPVEGTAYQINTIAGESATVRWDAFTENTANGTWETDISGMVEQSVTEIDSVDVYLVDSYETTHVIENDFTVEQITDQETGENYSSVTPSQLTTGNPENFQTAEDFKANNQMWNDIYDKIDRLFKEVDGGGGGGIFGGGLPSLPGFGVIESAVIVVLSLAGLNAVSS